MFEPKLHVDYRFGVFFLIGGALPQPVGHAFQERIRHQRGHFNI